MTNAEAQFNKSLRPRKPEGSLGRTAQDVHLDSHTAPELLSQTFHVTLVLCSTSSVLVNSPHARSSVTEKTLNGTDCAGALTLTVLHETKARQIRWRERLLVNKPFSKPSIVLAISLIGVRTHRHQTQSPRRTAPRRLQSGGRWGWREGGSGGGGGGG